VCGENIWNLIPHPLSLAHSLSEAKRNRACALKDVPVFTEGAAVALPEMKVESRYVN
jgi:hypothetical protein